MAQPVSVKGRRYVSTKHGEILPREGDFGLHPLRETRISESETIPRGAGWHGRAPGTNFNCDLGSDVVEKDTGAITVAGGKPFTVGGPLGTNGPVWTGTLIDGVWTSS